MADALHERGADTFGDIANHRVARGPVLGAHLYLDQLMMFQRQVDLGEKRVGDALSAHLQHRPEIVCLPTQETGLGGGQGSTHVDHVQGGTGTQGIMAARSPRLSPPVATRSKSSQRWLKEHFSDPYVKKAQAEGLRSRAAYKLEELVERDRLLKPGIVVVDLGAAPGGWSQWVRQELNRLDAVRPGRVIALDILDMPTLAGVEFHHGDFREDAVLAALEASLNGQPVDLVLSDMAPNMSGVDAVDLPRAMHLAELAMDFADHHLRVGGAFLIKLFQGVGFDEYVRELRRRYAKVVIRKPAASRKRSPEVYALAQGKLAQMK